MFSNDAECGVMLELALLEDDDRTKALVFWREMLRSVTFTSTDGPVWYLSCFGYGLGQQTLAPLSGLI